MIICRINDPCQIYMDHLFAIKMLTLIKISFILLLVLVASSLNGPATWTTQLSLNAFRLPIITLCKKYELLLDTGSKDSWLADLSCRDCPQRVSICPQGGQGGKEIKYFKGSVKGELSFLSTCLGSYRVVCVREAQGMENVGAMGILGLRGATGKGIMRALMQSHLISTEAFAFYQGYRENRLFLGQIPKRFIEDELKLSINNQEWHLTQFGITICGQSLKQIDQYSLFFDSGSNIIILPSPVYDQASSIIIEQMKKIGCTQLSQFLSFLCPIQSISHEIILIKLAKEDSEMRLPLKDVIACDNEKCKVRIDQGTGNKIIFGAVLMKNYIISFGLQGNLRIHAVNKGLFHDEIFNFKVILFEYVLAVAVISFLMKKGYQIAEVAINRKIVI